MWAIIPVLALLLRFALALDVRYATWNLRFDSKPDNITVAQSLASLPGPLETPTPYYANITKERPWSTRRIKVWQRLADEEPDVIGFQEAVHRQVLDMKTLLGIEWAWVGVGRDDGKEAGEYNPVFFRLTRFELIEWDTFWLTRTYDTPSIYPKA